MTQFDTVLDCGSIRIPSFIHLASSNFILGVARSATVPTHEQDLATFREKAGWRHTHNTIYCFRHNLTLRLVLRHSQRGKRGREFQIKSLLLHTEHLTALVAFTK